MAASRERRRVEVRGAVDGLAFRLWVRNVADSLKLGGSVRRLGPGVCEAVVQGDRLCIRQFIATCKRGPDGATPCDVSDFPLPFGNHLFEFVVER